MELKKIHKEELHNLSSSLYTIIAIE